MRFPKRLLAALAFAGLALLGTPREAHAVLALAAETSTGARIFAVDNVMSGDPLPPGFTAPAGYTLVFDTSSIVGRLSLADQEVDGLFVDSSTQVSRMGTAGGLTNLLRSSSLEVTNTSDSAVSAIVVVGDTDFTGPATLVQTTASGTFVDAATAPGSSIALSWKNDPGNTQPVEETGIANYPGNEVATFAFAPTASTLSYSFDSGTGPLAVPDPANFSMSLRFELTLAPGAQLINRGQAIFKPVNVVPEPWTAVMALTTLPLLGVGGWLRRRRAQA